MKNMKHERITIDRKKLIGEKKPDAEVSAIYCTCKNPVATPPNAVRMKEGKPLGCGVCKLPFKMRKNIPKQVELSDEEIFEIGKNIVIEKWGVENVRGSKSYLSFLAGAKWMRDKLK